MGSSCLKGNFASIQRQLSLEPCVYSGSIPPELEGGQYVRNGGNPAFGSDVAGDVHMFDGDGMLTGVFFQCCEGSSREIVPHFVNRYILTDVFIASRAMSTLSAPILPSIATLLRPFGSALSVMYSIGRFITLVMLSHLRDSRQSIRKISVANTAILYHDRRALATCQTGPPMRVQLPNLETVGWYNGGSADNELPIPVSGVNAFGDSGLLGFLKNWATAHPRVDPITGELISFQSSFLPPFVWYSVIPESELTIAQRAGVTHSQVPGISSPKFMHDFGVSLNHTVILDLPMSLNPVNLTRGRPIIQYDKRSRSRFGVFPRYDPSAVRWFEADPCFIFHTVGTWDEVFTGPSGSRVEQAVNMLACRYTSAAVLYSTGGLDAPMHFNAAEHESDGRLYYYRFLLSGGSQNLITHQWALSAVPFELPTVSPASSMAAPNFVYGCSSKDSIFAAAAGRPMKIDCLVKIDVKTLIHRGIQKEPKAGVGCVDERTVQEICASDHPEDPIKIFQPPAGWYTQEPQFVPRRTNRSEDDGYLLTLMFDESQIDADGNAASDARSELWILDARDMKTVVAKVLLPQRVPYGFHGHWFPNGEIEGQRPFFSSRTAQMQVE